MTLDVLFQWYRQGEIDIASGPLGSQQVHFNAPPVERVQPYMDQFVNWYNDSLAQAQTGELSGLTRAGIAHIWFETIHPYDDGNGRIGRAITDQVLSQALGYPMLASVSTSILKKRDSYYDALERASQSLEISRWLDFFNQAVLESLEIALVGVNRVLDKMHFWEAHNELSMKERQVKAINRMFELNPDQFNMTKKKYANLTRCSLATASRDLAELEKWSCLVVSGGGRSTKYNLVI